jgi:hypothetical protein
MKAGLSDVLLFVISLCVVLRFFNSPNPISTYESRIDVLLLCDSLSRLS